MNSLLTIGSMDLDPKDQNLLRSLIRLLDGRMRCQLRYEDDPALCGVVFVPADWHRRLSADFITVRVAEAGLYHALAASGGLVVPQPMRLPHIQAVLEVVSDLVANSVHATASNGVRSVFVGLTRHMIARERRITVFPLSDGNRLIVDFAKGTVHATLSEHELMAGFYMLEDPYRALDADLENLDGIEPWRLRDLVWRLAAHLGDAGVEGGTFTAQYRLLRWPEAVALTRAGYPKLVALLTSRPLGFDKICELSGTSVPTVQWFLEASLAMGIATPIGGASPAHVTTPARFESDPMPDASQRPLLARLKEKLKLW